MTKNRSIQVACSIVLFGGGFGAQANEGLSCPPTVAVSQKATTLPSDWEVSSRSNEAMHTVSGVNFYDGPPNELVGLTPSDGKTVGKKRTATWKLYEKRNSGQGFWIECMYTYTNVVLSKRVPDSIRECSVYFDKNSRVEHDYIFERMECK